MNDVPAWLAERLAVAATPRDATRGLLFHGTIEPFEGPLVASSWERMRWFAETPEIAQSYCAESGSEVLTGFMPYSLDEHFVPHHDFSGTLFEAMGFEVAAMDATRNRYGRMDSYRILPGHPSNRDARAFLENMGYAFGDESAWIKVRRRETGGDEIMPADWKTAGRLFVVERPGDLRLYDLQSSEEGGITGRQWMRTDLFETLANSGDWDGIVIDDINQSRKLGQFGHRSVGLFQPAIERLRTHVIACVHADPYDTWHAVDGRTTPEFDSLHRSSTGRPEKLAA